MPSIIIKNKNHSTSIMFSRILYVASGGRKIRKFELIRELDFLFTFLTSDSDSACKNTL